VLERAVSFYYFPTTSSSEKIIESINGLLISVLFSEPSLDRLCRIFQTIEPWVSSKEYFQRERALFSMGSLLERFIELKKADAQKKERIFLELGSCIAMLIPRCTDPTASVRSLAIRCVQLSLCMFPPVFVGSLSILVCSVIVFLFSLEKRC